MTLVSRSPSSPATSALSGTSSSRSTCRLSATRSRRSWPRPILTRSHCAPSTHWPYSPLTRRRQPRKSSGDGRRSASPTSSSAPALRTRSPRSLLRWPDTEPDLPYLDELELAPRGTPLRTHRSSAALRAAGRTVVVEPTKCRPVTAELAKRVAQSVLDDRADTALEAVAGEQLAHPQNLQCMQSSLEVRIARVDSRRPVGGVRGEARRVGPAVVELEPRGRQCPEGCEQLSHRAGHPRKAGIVETDRRNRVARKRLEHDPRRIGIQVDVADVRNRDPGRRCWAVESLHRPHAIVGVLAAAVALHDDALAGPKRHEVRAILEAPLRALGTRDRPAKQLLDLLPGHAETLASCEREAGRAIVRLVPLAATMTQATVTSCTRLSDARVGSSGVCEDRASDLLPVGMVESVPCSLEGQQARSWDLFGQRLSVREREHGIGGCGGCKSPRRDRGWWLRGENTPPR